MCKHAPIDGFQSFLFESQDISMLTSPTACVNNICINRCIPLLFSALNISTNNNFVVFSTHHLTHIHYHTSTYTNFWMKDIWIIPIHWPMAAHWVLCIAHLSWQELQLFNSLGEQKPRWNDIQVCNYYIYFIYTLIWSFTGHYATHCSTDVNCKTKISRNWIWWPSVSGIPTYGMSPSIFIVIFLTLPQTIPLQSNSYDCGIWLLVGVAAVLCDYDITGLNEDNILHFQYYLRTLVLSLPIE